MKEWTSPDIAPAETPLIPSPSLIPIIQRDDGRWATGLHDDGPGYESRRYAEQVAARCAEAHARSPAGAHRRGEGRHQAVNERSEGTPLVGRVSPSPDCNDLPSSPNGITI